MLRSIVRLSQSSHSLDLGQSLSGKCVCVCACVRPYVCVWERESVSLQESSQKFLSVGLCWVVMSKFKPCETFPLPLMKGCLLYHLDNIWLNFNTQRSRPLCFSSVNLSHLKHMAYVLSSKGSKWWDSQPFHEQKQPQTTRLTPFLCSTFISSFGISRVV